MELIQLVYVSRLSRPMSSEDLGILIEQSSIDNAARDVSGVLLCHGTNLMQLLEGDKPVVRALFNKISADHRHRDVFMLLDKKIDRRLYPEWGMGLADLKSGIALNRDRLTRLVESVQASSNTAGRNVEARVLLRDFTMQLIDAA